MNKAPDHFSPDAADAPPADTTIRRMRYPCAAHQCPMPGTLFLGGGGEGVCAWHAREPAADWPTITQAIRDWECVVRAINRARRTSTDPTLCADPKSQDAALAEAWQDMQPAISGSGWKNRLAPLAGENFGDWGRRLETFLGARVKERQRGAGTVDETAPTPVVADMRAKLRADAPKGNASGWAGE